MIRDLWDRVPSLYKPGHPVRNVIVFLLLLLILAWIFVGFGGITTAGADEEDVVMVSFADSETSVEMQELTATFSCVDQPWLCEVAAPAPPPPAPPAERSPAPCAGLTGPECETLFNVSIYLPPSGGELPPYSEPSYDPPPDSGGGGDSGGYDPGNGMGWTEDDWCSWNDCG